MTSNLQFGTARINFNKGILNFCFLKRSVKYYSTNVLQVNSLYKSKSYHGDARLLQLSLVSHLSAF